VSATSLDVFGGIGRAVNVRHFAWVKSITLIHSLHTINAAVSSVTCGLPTNPRAVQKAFDAFRSATGRLTVIARDIDGLRLVGFQVDNVHLTAEAAQHRLGKAAAFRSPSSEGRRPSRSVLPRFFMQSCASPVQFLSPKSDLRFNQARLTT
jgi:hypothetical protein